MAAQPSPQPIEITLADDVDRERVYRLLALLDLELADGTADELTAGPNPQRLANLAAAARDLNAFVAENTHTTEQLQAVYRAALDELAAAVARIEEVINGDRDYYASLLQEDRARPLLNALNGALTTRSQQVAAFSGDDS